MAYRSRRGRGRSFKSRVRRSRRSVGRFARRMRKRVRKVIRGALMRRIGQRM